MPVCSGCSASYSDDYSFCPYCGKVKSEEKAVNINASVSQKPLRYEYCVLENIIEKDKPKGFLEKRLLIPTSEWIWIVAIHQSTGQELYRATTGGNHYQYHHGTPKAKDEIKSIIEKGKTEVWQFLEKNGWEFYDSKPGDKLPRHFFRRSLQG